MYETGSVTGMLDWMFFIADPSLDLANTMNVILIYGPHIFKDVPQQFWEQYADGILKAYQNIRTLNQERINIFRVWTLLEILCAADPPEHMQHPEARRDFVAFIEQATKLHLALAPTS